MTSLKPHYILVRCVQPGGPFVMGQTYYALRWHRPGTHETWLDVWVDGEVRVEKDERFQPCNPENWWLFSEPQRRRFQIPPPWSRLWSTHKGRRQISGQVRSAA